MKKILAALIFSSLLNQTQAQEVWKNVGSGLGHNVNLGEGVHALLNDTINHLLYAAGTFTVADDSINCSGIAIWNGTKWATNFYIPGGGTPAWSSLAMYDGKIFAGAKNGTVIYYDGIKWQTVGAFDGEVHCFAVYHNKLYVGGHFTEVNGKYGDRIVSYDGVKWDSVGGGGIYWSHACCSSVDAMCVWNDKLIIAGTFDRAINDTGEIVTGSIVSWNDTSYTSLGRGMSIKTTGIGLGYINTVVTYKDDLYAGGQFDSAGGVFAFNMARWDGIKWNALTSGFGNEPRCFVVKDSSLYVGGSIYLTGYPIDSSSYGVLRWDGTSWNKVDNFLGNVSSLTIFDDTLFAGGYISKVDNSRVRGIARLLPDTIYDSVPDRIIMRNERINIYPNPVIDNLHIESGEELIEQVQISNLLGQTILATKLSQTKKETEIDASNLLQGIYLLRVKTKEGWSMGKFVKPACRTGRE